MAEEVEAIERSCRRRHHHSRLLRFLFDFNWKFSCFLEPKRHTNVTPFVSLISDCIEADRRDETRRET